jgi:hypothetical protein
MNSITEFSKSYLLTRLEYDPNTGIFKWTNSKYKATRGKQAGAIHPSGYVVIELEGINCKAHRLAYTMMTGEILNSTEILDHIDHNGYNNIWTNLRLATMSQNSMNARMSKANTSGYKGVHYCKTKCRWFATLTTNGKVIRRTCYTKDQAIEVIRHLRAKHHGEFANY